MNSKTYKLPNGKTAVFEYDVCEIGKVTLECMDELMAMIADRPKGEWIDTGKVCSGANVYACSVCGEECDEMPTCMGKPMWKYCPNCGARMKGATDGNQ